MTELNMEIRKSAGTAVLKDEVKAWSKSFAKLMASALGQQIFTRFLETEYSDENMLFWHACEDFKKEKKSVKRQIMAKEMYSMFLIQSAPLEINIDSKARMSLLKKIDQNPSKDVFDEAQDQVYALMERDCYVRFVRSDVYVDFLKHVEMDGRPHSHQSFSSVYEFWGLYYLPELYSKLFLSCDKILHYKLFIT